MDIQRQSDQYGYFGSKTSFTPSEDSDWTDPEITPWLNEQTSQMRGLGWTLDSNAGVFTRQFPKALFVIFPVDGLVSKWSWDRRSGADYESQGVTWGSPVEVAKALEIGSANFWRDGTSASVKTAYDYNNIDYNLDAVEDPDEKEPYDKFHGPDAIMEWGDGVEHPYGLPVKRDGSLGSRSAAYEDNLKRRSK